MSQIKRIEELLESLRDQMIALCEQGMDVRDIRLKLLSIETQILSSNGFDPDQIEGALEEIKWIIIDTESDHAGVTALASTAYRPAPQHIVYIGHGPERKKMRRPGY